MNCSHQQSFSKPFKIVVAVSLMSIADRTHCYIVYVPPMWLSQNIHTCVRASLRVLWLLQLWGNDEKARVEENEVSGYQEEVTCMSGSLSAAFTAKW